MMAERNLKVDHVTIWRWVYTELRAGIEPRCRPELRRTNGSWRVETYLRVAGKWSYLYRRGGFHRIAELKKTGELGRRCSMPTRSVSEQHSRADPALLRLENRQFEPRQDRPAWHRHEGDLLVGGRQKIGQLKEWAHPSSDVSNVKIPNGIRVTLNALDHADACSGGESRLRALPGYNAAVNGIVEDVLGHIAPQFSLRSPKAGVLKLSFLPPSQPGSNASLDACEAKPLEVGGPPDVGWMEADEINAVGFAALEGGERGREWARQHPNPGPPRSPRLFRAKDQASQDYRGFGSTTRYTKAVGMRG